MALPSPPLGSPPLGGRGAALLTLGAVAEVLACLAVVWAVLRDHVVRHHRRERQARQQEPPGQEGRGVNTRVSN